MGYYRIVHEAHGNSFTAVATINVAGGPMHPGVVSRVTPLPSLEWVGADLTADTGREGRAI